PTRDFGLFIPGLTLSWRRWGEIWRFSIKVLSFLASASPSFWGCSCTGCGTFAAGTWYKVTREVVPLFDMETADYKDKKILLVDDEGDILNLLEAVLRKENFVH